MRTFSSKLGVAIAFAVMLGAAAWHFWPATPLAPPEVLSLLPAPGGTRTVPTCNLTTASPAWTQHLIHNGLRGTDGIIVRDFNGDGAGEVVSPNEQGAVTSLSMHPGCATVRAVANWTTAQIIPLPSNEGACVGDLDMDGRLDIVGTAQSGAAPIVKFGPALDSDLTDPADWVTMTLTAFGGLGIGWMTCSIADVDGDGHTDLIMGGETGASTGELSWIKAPATSKRTAGGWTPKTLIQTSGRIMSIHTYDIGAASTPLVPDGDLDILFASRATPNVGVFWFEGSGGGAGTVRPISVSLPWHGNTHVYMLFRPGDIDDDGDEDMCAATEATVVRCMENVGTTPGSIGNWLKWRSTMIPAPTAFGNNTSTSIADLNEDEYPDVIQGSFDGATGTQSCIVWRNGAFNPGGTRWDRGEIMGLTHGGIICKVDELIPYDVDCDGDEDIVFGNQGNEDGAIDTSEGIYWAENPCLN